MSHHTIPHKFTTAPHMWLYITMALGLVLCSQAAATKECTRETPLPADVHLIAPGPEVPAALAEFAGVWTGEWEDSGELCHTLVVEEVLANGSARVISSVGTSVALNIQLPGFVHATGRIVDGVLRFHGPGPDRPELAYRVAGETLLGTYKGEGLVRLTRVADVRQVGCERRDGELPPAPSASGLIVDGALYLRGCETRWGPDPYCRHMRHGVFSVTKSLGAAVALLWLAQTYGDQVFELKIKDYVTVTAAHEGWERVTFADTLNMATGIGDKVPQREPNRPFADADTKLNTFLQAPTAKQKLAIAFLAGQYPWGPGEVLRYINMHTFVLAAAMDSFLKRQAGPQAHLWDMVMAEVFRPIGIFHAPMLHTQETGGGRGIPHLLHGLYPTIDDLAKLTTLLQHGGRHQGRQLLSAAKLAEALDTSEARGLPSGQQNRFGEGRYHLSFWSVPYRTATGCVFQIPYMLGYGGNLVVLLPNGVSAFRFADGGHLDLESLVLAGEAIRPFPCPAGSVETSPPPMQPLSASDLRTEVPGHTFYRDRVTSFPGSFGGRLSMLVSADGLLYGTFTRRPDGGTEHDVGRWHIKPEGQFCRTWHVWDHRRERCYTLHVSLPVLYHGDETFAFAVTDRWGTELYRRVPGNPEGY